MVAAMRSNWIEAVPNTAGEARRTRPWFSAKVSSRLRSWSRMRARPARSALPNPESLPILPVPGLPSSDMARAMGWCKQTLGHDVAAPKLRRYKDTPQLPRLHRTLCLWSPSIVVSAKNRRLSMSLAERRLRRGWMVLLKAGSQRRCISIFCARGGSPSGTPSGLAEPSATSSSTFTSLNNHPQCYLWSVVSSDVSRWQRALRFDPVLPNRLIIHEPCGLKFYSV